MTRDELIQAIFIQRECIRVNEMILNDLKQAEDTALSNKQTAAQAAQAAEIAWSKAVNDRENLEEDLVDMNEELKRLEEELANLPQEPKPYDCKKRTVTNPLDGFGIRSDGTNNAIYNTKCLTDRLGVAPRWYSVFEGVQPALTGRWDKLEETAAVQPNARYVVACRTPACDIVLPNKKRRVTRGDAPTMAELNDSIADMNAAITGADMTAALKMIDGLKDLPYIDQVELRGLGHEHFGTWYRWCILFLTNGKFVLNATTKAKMLELARANRGMQERFINLCYSRMGAEKFKKLTFRYNLAGTVGTLGDDPEVFEILSEAFPRASAIPPETVIVGSTDDYVSALSDVGNFSQNIVRSVAFFKNHPNVVGFGIDETGGHCSITLSRPNFDKLTPAFVGFADALVDTVIELCAEDYWAGSLFYETSTPNDRPVTCRIFVDEDPNINYPNGKPVLGADGKQFVSSHAPLAQRFIERVKLLKAA